VIPNNRRNAVKSDRLIIVLFFLLIEGFTFLSFLTFEGFDVSFLLIFGDFSSFLFI